MVIFSILVILMHQVIFSIGNQMKQWEDTKCNWNKSNECVYCTWEPHRSFNTRLPKGGGYHPLKDYFLATELKRLILPPIVFS